MISKEEIALWFDRGVAEEATHLIVVCDTFDWEDYPVFVSKDQNVKEEVDKFKGKDMQKVMEVYDLSKDKNEQVYTGELVFNY